MTTMPHASVCAFLAEVRARRGLTQVQLAKAMGTQQSAVSDLELGRSGPPNLDTLTRWAAALDLELSVQLTERVRHSFTIATDTEGVA